MKKSILVNNTVIDCYDDGHIEYYITSRNAAGYYSKHSSTFGSKENCGYMRVTINGRRYQVHVLIATAFIPNPENKPYVDHINRNKIDNRVENLRWVTAKENARNQQSVYKSFKEFGIHRFENPNLYSKLYREKNKEAIKQKRKLYRAKSIVIQVRPDITKKCHGVKVTQEEFNMLKPFKPSERCIMLKELRLKGDGKCQDL